MDGCRAAVRSSGRPAPWQLPFPPRAVPPPGRRFLGCSRWRLTSVTAQGRRSHTLCPPPVRVRPHRSPLLKPGRAAWRGRSQGPSSARPSSELRATARPRLPRPGGGPAVSGNSAERPHPGQLPCSFVFGGLLVQPAAGTSPTGPARAGGRGRGSLAPLPHPLEGRASVGACRLPSPRTASSPPEGPSPVRRPSRDGRVPSLAPGGPWARSASLPPVRRPRFPFPSLHLITRASGVLEERGGRPTPLSPADPGQRLPGDRGEVVGRTPLGPVLLL